MERRRGLGGPTRVLLPLFKVRFVGLGGTRSIPQDFEGKTGLCLVELRVMVVTG